MAIHIHTMGKENQTRVTPPNREAKAKEGRTLSSHISAGTCGDVGHLRRECPALKDKGLSPRGNAGAAHRE